MRAGAPILFATSILVTVCAGCAHGPRRLDPQLAWAGENRARLEAMIASLGKRSASYDAVHRPVATFDWDNTCLRNDAGDATFYWMVKSDRILQPPGKNWSVTSPYLTSDAVAALDTACGALAGEGKALPTSTSAACASEIVSVYDQGRTLGGKKAFAGFDHRRMQPQYEWGAALGAGHTPDEVRGFAEAARREGLAAPVGATKEVGSVGRLAGYLRYYDQIRDLIGTLRDNGFDVWIVSASSQWIAEVFAAGVGIARDHVIGVRVRVGTDGKCTYDLEGCGGIPDGRNDGQGNNVGNAIIPYIDGKRCFINKVIYGDRSAGALQQNPDAKSRQAFAAGDSDTDITFLKDASALRLVLDRNKHELMCNALLNDDGKWIVNPMFIEPLDPRTRPYPCSSTACVDEAGKPGPCRDNLGNVIPDQTGPVNQTGPANHVDQGR